MLTQLKKPLTLVLIGLAALVLTLNALVVAPVLRMRNLARDVDFAITKMSTDEGFCPDTVSYKTLVKQGLLEPGLRNPFSGKPLRILAPLDKEEPGCLKYLPFGPRYVELTEQQEDAGVSSRRDSFTLIAYGKSFGCERSEHVLLQWTGEPAAYYYELPLEDMSQEELARAIVLKEYLVVRDAPSILFCFSH